MLKIIHSNSGLPISYPVHPSAEFEPGMFGQLTTIGNDIMVTVSDGTCPLGIIDDSRTNSFTRPMIDEIIQIEVDSDDIEENENGYKVNSRDVTGYLKNPYILESSFISDVGIILNPINGVVTVPAGTVLNDDADGNDVLDGFKIICNYIYRIANKPGDDTTIGSQRVTIHYTRGFYATDQFDTRQIYPLNATLYVGLDGRLTTEQPTAGHPGVAFVTAPPSAIESSLELVLL